MIDAGGEALERVFRTEHAAIVGGLVRRFGDVDLAEDAVSEAYAEATTRWAASGAPANPAGWLSTTAKHKALDRLRRESARNDKEREATSMADHDVVPLGVVDDDRLRLLFMCCHPALGPDVRVALTLRLVSGLTVEEIAAAFLVPDRTMAQRITRAKRKIRDAGIPFNIPARHDLPARMAGILTALYLLAGEGYLAHSADHGTRDDLSVEAIRLTRLLTRLAPLDGEARGLLALLVLNQARRPARVDDEGLVLLADQDRTRWDRALLVEGLGLAADLLDGPERPGQYGLLATIAAVHMAAPSADDVDWPRVVGLYDALLAVAPSPVTELNRAIAVARVEGAGPALAIVDGLDLSSYHPWHVARAHLLDALGRAEEADVARQAALALAVNPLEVDHLTRWSSRS